MLGSWAERLFYSASVRAAQGAGAGAGAGDGGGGGGGSAGGHDHAGGGPVSRTPPPPLTPAELEQYLTALTAERSKVEVFKRELPCCTQLLDGAIAYIQTVVASQPQQAEAPSTQEADADQPSSSTPSVETTSPPVAPLPPPPLFSPPWPHLPWPGAQPWAPNAQMWGASKDGMAIAKGQQVPFSAPVAIPAVAMKTEQTSPVHVSQSYSPPRMPSPVHASPPVVVPQPHRPAVVLASHGGAFTPFLPAREPDPNRSPPRSQSQEHASTSRPSAEACRTSHSKETRSDSDGDKGAPRKARRCWNTELHRRFVDALEQLGGCHTATPKQIRELMLVPGLTNDEVKSHLQKYRLHLRRPQSSPQPRGPPEPWQMPSGAMPPMMHPGMLPGMIPAMTAHMQDPQSYQAAVEAWHDPSGVTTLSLGRGQAPPQPTSSAPLMQETNPEYSGDASAQAAAPASAPGAPWPTPSGSHPMDGSTSGSSMSDAAGSG
eukprot:jgi/Chlat1/8216/Chrsp76S07637